MKVGYQNEIDFINYLNNKKYKEVNILFQELLKQLYPNIRENDVIGAYKYGRYAKVDMVIRVNNIEKGISIKSGSKNSVHIEPIDKFIMYLKSLNLTKTEQLLRYLYSDGTNNNSGRIRQSSSEYKKNHKSDIIEINKELEKIKNDLIRRFLIETDVNYKIKVDMFIIGNLEDFLWSTKEEVVHYLTNTSQESTGVHVSNLFIQNWNKNLKYNPRYEYCRNYVQIKWYSIFDDIIKIMILRNEDNNK